MLRDGSVVSQQLEQKQRRCHSVVLLFALFGLVWYWVGAFWCGLSKKKITWWAAFQSLLIWLLRHQWLGQFTDFSEYSMFSASSKLFNWSLPFPLLYSSSALSQAALLISNSGQTSWKTCSWPLASSFWSFISTKSCGRRLFPWRGFGRFLSDDSKKKRKNRREVKSAKKGHKQHTWESVKLLCSLNSTIHLTNRLFFF